MQIIKDITLDSLYYLKDEILADKLKKFLNINSIEDLEISPDLVELINEFFLDEENTDLLNEKIEKGYFLFDKPDKIYYCGINCDSKYLRGITFNLTYNLPQTLIDKVEKFEKELILEIKSIFKQRGFFKYTGISHGSVHIEYSGYFSSEPELTQQFLDYCASKKYFYNLSIKNSDIRFTIQKVIRND